MKIHSNNSIDTNVLQGNIKVVEGTVLKARIIDVVDNEVLLDLGNGCYLSGKTELDLQSQKNRVISFLIKSLDSNNIELRPLLNTSFDNNEKQMLFNNQDAYIKEILKSYQIEDNDNNIETIKTMIKFSMSLNKANVLNVTKYVNKMESLINTNSSEKLYLLESNHDPLNIDIVKFIKNKEEQIRIKQDNFGVSEVTNKNIADEVSSQLKDLVPQNKITPEMIKKITFLIKSNICVSINNIKQLINVIDKGNLFEEKINQILDVLLIDDLENKGVLENLKKRINSITITFSQQDKENIIRYFNEIKSVFELINKQVITKKDSSDELVRKIKEVNDSINFLNKLNENNTFLYLPFNLKDESIKNSLYILRKKKNLKTTDKISLFIKLTTKNLKDIEVMCTLMDDSINLNFKVEKEFLNLFEEKKHDLNNALNSIGYNKISIFVNQHDNTDIFDILSDDNHLTYKLNIKV